MNLAEAEDLGRAWRHRSRAHLDPAQVGEGRGHPQGENSVGRVGGGGAGIRHRSRSDETFEPAYQARPP